MSLLSKNNDSSFGNKEYENYTYIVLETENIGQSSIKETAKMSLSEISRVSKEVEGRVLSLQDNKIFTSNIVCESKNVHPYEEIQTPLDVSQKQSVEASHSFIPIEQTSPLNKILEVNKVNELMLEDKTLVLKQDRVGQENIEKNIVDRKVILGSVVDLPDEPKELELTIDSAVLKNTDKCDAALAIQNCISGNESLSDSAVNEQILKMEENKESMNITPYNESCISKKLIDGELLNNSEEKEEVKNLSEENLEMQVIESCLDCGKIKEVTHCSEETENNDITISFTFGINQMSDRISKQLKENIASISVAEKLDNCRVAESVTQIPEKDTCAVKTSNPTKTFMTAECSGNIMSDFPNKCVDEKCSTLLCLSPLKKNSEAREGSEATFELLAKNYIIEDSSTEPSKSLTLCQNNNTVINNFSEVEIEMPIKELNSHNIECNLLSTNITTVQNLECLDNLILPLSATQIFEQDRFKGIIETPALSQTLKPNEAMVCKSPESSFNIEDLPIAEPFIAKLHLENITVSDQLPSLKDSSKNLMEIKSNKMPLIQNTASMHKITNITQKEGIDDISEKLSYDLNGYNAETTTAKIQNLELSKEIHSLSASVPLFEVDVDKSLLNISPLTQVLKHIENDDSLGTCFKPSLTTNENVLVNRLPLLHKGVKSDKLTSVKNGSKNLMELEDNTHKELVPFNQDLASVYKMSKISKEERINETSEKLNNDLNSYAEIKAESSLDSSKNAHSLSELMPLSEADLNENIFDMSALAQSAENTNNGELNAKPNLTIEGSILINELQEGVEIIEKYNLPYKLAVKENAAMALFTSQKEEIATNNSVPEDSIKGKIHLEDGAKFDYVPSALMCLDNFDVGMASCETYTVTKIVEADGCEKLNNSVALTHISKAMNDDEEILKLSDLIIEENSTLNFDALKENPKGSLTEIYTVMEDSLPASTNDENKSYTTFSILDRIVEGKSEETSDLEVIVNLEDRSFDNLENELITVSKFKNNIVNEIQESAVKSRKETETVIEKDITENINEKTTVIENLNKTITKQLKGLDDSKLLEKIPRGDKMELQQLDATLEYPVNKAINNECSIILQLPLVKENVVQSEYKNTKPIIKENFVPNVKEKTISKEFSSREVIQDPIIGKKLSDVEPQIKLKLKNSDGKERINMRTSNMNATLVQFNLQMPLETMATSHKLNTGEKIDKNMSGKDGKIEEKCKMNDSNKLPKRVKKYPEIELYKPGKGLKKRTKDQNLGSISNDRKLNQVDLNESKDSKQKFLSCELPQQSGENSKSSTLISNAKTKISKVTSENRKERTRSNSLNITSQINCDENDFKTKDYSKFTSHENTTITNTDKSMNDDTDIPFSITNKSVGKKYSVRGRPHMCYNSSQSLSSNCSGHSDKLPLEKVLNMKNSSLKDDANNIQTNIKLKNNITSPPDNANRLKKCKIIQSAKHKTQHLRKHLESDSKNSHSCEQSYEIDGCDGYSEIVSTSTSYYTLNKSQNDLSAEPACDITTIPCTFSLNTGANHTEKTKEDSDSSENLSKSETESEDEMVEKTLSFENKSHVYSHLRGTANHVNTQRLQRNRQSLKDNLSPTKISSVKIKNAINEQKSREEKEYISEKGIKMENLENDENLQFLLKKDLKTDKVDSQQKSNERHSKGGGIIRLPTESTNETCTFASITSKCNLERTVIQDEPTLIQKQLFDPNNPDKPLVITIPCSYISYSGPPSPANMFNNVSSELHGTNTSLMMSGQSWQHSYTQYPTDYTDVSADLLLRQEGQKRIKPIIEKNLREIAVLEKDLTSSIAQGVEIGNSVYLGQCWQKLQLYFENIILANPRYCAENNIEQLLWKTVFYQVIEALRRKAETPQKQEIMNEAIINIVDKGTIYFENLLMKQQEIFGFNLDGFLDPEVVWPKEIPDAVRMTLISIQKILIYLGDLARYREQATKTTNYGKARSWYLKAQQIAPKNGRPYNQLAIVAIHTKRKLDAVYYYMRSLAASNPFLSARESLLSLFEEIRKKYEVLEKLNVEDETTQNASDHWRKSGNLLEEEEEKYEIWIHPDGSSSKRSSKLDNEHKDKLSDMSSADLNKRFLLRFLHVHGKLFTKIGMETFTDTVNKMLGEFSCLLRRSPLPLGALRLVQLMAINIFAVANTTLKGADQSMNPFCRSLLQEQALQVTFAMVTLMLERTIILLQEHVNSVDYPSELIGEDLAQILPSIKIWIDWMFCHKHLWIPPPVTGDFKICCRYNIWMLYADLLTTVQAFETNCVQFLKNKEEGYEPVILPEDNTLAGFLPLIEAVQNPMCAKLPFDKEQARNCLRLSHIQYFGQYLCGMQEPYLKFDAENKIYVSLVTALESVQNDETIQETKWESSEDDIDTSQEIDEYLEKNETSQSQEEKEIQMLWSRKEALKKAKEEQDNHRAQIQAVLQETRHKRPTVLEVHPCYLVPDTNCFIDHLPRMKSLLSSGQFRIVVPLVVINELDGLARGCLEDGTVPLDAHTRRVGQLAKDAVLFLEERFASREPRLRAITSKGSVLDTISFRSEDVSDSKGTNDDLILSCCLHYCKDRPEQFMPRDPDTPITLIREAALLTEDRNLRVKALAQNVPVRDLPAFLRWAKIR